MMYEQNRFDVREDNGQWIIIDTENVLTISYRFNDKYSAWHICNNMNYLNGRVKH